MIGKFVSAALTLLVLGAQADARVYTRAAPQSSPLVLTNDGRFISVGGQQPQVVARPAVRRYYRPQRSAVRPARWQVVVHHPVPPREISSTPPVQKSTFGPTSGSEWLITFSGLGGRIDSAAAKKIAAAEGRTFVLFGYGEVARAVQFVEQHRGAPYGVLGFSAGAAVLCNFLQQVKVRGLPAPEDVWGVGLYDRAPACENPLVVNYLDETGQRHAKEPRTVNLGRVPHMDSRRGGMALLAERQRIAGTFAIIERPVRTVVDTVLAIPRAIISAGRGLSKVCVGDHCGTVASQAAEKFAGLFRDLTALGYDIGSPGCYSAGGHMRGSLHHWGGACDLFNQTARNRTALRQPPPKVQIEVAAKNGLTSGCIWDSPDCGHFDLSGQQGARRAAVYHPRRVYRAVYYRRHRG